MLGVEPAAPDERYVGRMAAVPLPAGVDGDALQRRLYDEDRIEVAVASGLLRVSFAMYNEWSDLDRLVTALRRILASV